MVFWFMKFLLKYCCIWQQLPSFIFFNWQRNRGGHRGAVKWSLDVSPLLLTYRSSRCNWKKLKTYKIYQDFKQYLYLHRVEKKHKAMGRNWSTGLLDYGLGRSRNTFRGSEPGHALEITFLNSDYCFWLFFHSFLILFYSDHIFLNLSVIIEGYVYKYLIFMAF